jgi:hypothetical protein
LSHNGVRCLRVGRLLVVGLPLDRCAEFAEGRPDRPQQRGTRLRRILAHLRVAYGVFEGPSRILDRLAHPVVGRVDATWISAGRIGIDGSSTDQIGADLFGARRGAGWAVGRLCTNWARTGRDAVVVLAELVRDLGELVGQGGPCLVGAIKPLPVVFVHATSIRSGVQRRKGRRSRPASRRATPKSNLTRSLGGSAGVNAPQFFVYSLFVAIAGCAGVAQPRRCGYLTEHPRPSSRVVHAAPEQITQCEFRPVRRYSAITSAGVARRCVPSPRITSASPSGPTAPIPWTGRPANACACAGLDAAGRKIHLNSARCCSSTNYLRNINAGR